MPEAQSYHSALEGSVGECQRWSILGRSSLRWWNMVYLDRLEGSVGGSSCCGAGYTVFKGLFALDSFLYSVSCLHFIVWRRLCWSYEILRNLHFFFPALIHFFFFLTKQNHRHHSRCAGLFKPPAEVAH